MANGDLNGIENVNQLLPNSSQQPTSVSQLPPSAAQPPSTAINASPQDQSHNAQELPHPSSRGGGSNSAPKTQYNPFQDPEIIKHFAANEIVPQSSNNPNNQYVTCKVCNKSFKLDTKKALDTHINSKNHYREINYSKFRNDLRNTKPRNQSRKWRDSHIQAGIHKSNCLTPSEICRRSDIFKNQLKTVIQEKYPDLTLLLYGSVVTQIGTIDSDVNVWVDGKVETEVGACGVQQEPTLVLLADFLKSRIDSGVLQNCRIIEDYDQKYPALVVEISNLKFRLATDGRFSTTIAHYIREYYQYSEYLVQLTQVVRCLWANKLKLDRPNEGTLAPHAFSLMCIFFMQQRRLLPVLEFLPEPEPELKNQDSQDSANNIPSETNLPPTPNSSNQFPQQFKNQNSNNSRSRDNSCGNNADSNNSQNLNFQSQQFQNPNFQNPNFQDPRNCFLDKSYKVQIADSEDKKQIDLYLLPHEEYVTYPKKFNNGSGGLSIYRLAEDFFKFYLEEFIIESHIVRIHEVTNLRATHKVRMDRNWPCKRWSIEDIPKNKTQNIAKTMNSTASFDFYIERMRDMFFYLKTLKRRDSAKFEPETEQNLQRQVQKLSLENEAECISQNGGNINTNSTFDQILLDITNNGQDPQNENTSCPAFTAEALYSTSVLPICPKVCSECGSEDHVIEHCEKTINGLRKIIFVEKTEIKPENIEAVSQLATQIQLAFYQDQQQQQLREEARHQIEAFLEENTEYLKSNGVVFNGKLKVNLFGSSANGFGSKTSDLDCCLTVEGCETALSAGFSSEKGEREVTIIAGLMQKLVNLNYGLQAQHVNSKEFRSIFQHVEAVPDAKVPIIRFIHVATGLEGDLSIYNTLPLRNTKLLRTYANFDDRILPLGFLLKQFCKTVEIGDASRGSLSSYAYLMLLIHYLQHKKVLPNLQEGNDTNQVPFHNWNTYFVENPDQLEQLKTNFKSNQATVGELWFGFLYYYAFEFKWGDHVVCIRKSSLETEPLTCFTKKWTNKHFCIEDPFELSHNLGTGVSKQMALYILQIFVNTYKFFSNNLPETDLPNEINILGYLNRQKLQIGKRPPTDRLCHHCGHIGHFKNNCPKMLEQQQRRTGEAMQNRNQALESYQNRAQQQFSNWNHQKPTYNQNNHQKSNRDRFNRRHENNFQQNDHKRNDGKKFEANGGQQNRFSSEPSKKFNDARSLIDAVRSNTASTSEVSISDVSNGTSARPIPKPVQRFKSDSTNTSFQPFNTGSNSTVTNVNGSNHNPQNHNQNSSKRSGKGRKKNNSVNKLENKLDNKLANGGKPDGSNPGKVNNKDVSSNKTQRSKKTKPQTNASSTDTTSDVAPKPSGKVRLLQKSGPEIQQNAGAHRLFQMATAPLQANFSKSNQKCAANFTNKPSTRRPRKKQAEQPNQPNKETDTEKHQKKPTNSSKPKPNFNKGKNDAKTENTSNCKADI